MRKSLVAAGLVMAAAAGLTACQSTSRALGLRAAAPDEFKVIAKAPLVLPPDYGLRPPAPGEPRPQELQPESRAREALLGARQAENRSAGEKSLVAKAGADRADPLIRYVIDDEYGDLAYKDKSFADYVMFWRKDDPKTQVASTGLAQTPGANQPVAIDPQAEAKRLAALTGNKPVIIRREAKPKRKLPGL
ncbi:MAG TPA: DUF3035 domain-containing protein [Caulobacteraceae bacterium]|nr:DUF3035 domain-containing protein [Caulobacteraceae bacterium]